MVSKIAFVNLSKTLNLNLTFQSVKWDWQYFLSYWDSWTDRDRPSSSSTGFSFLLLSFKYTWLLATSYKYICITRNSLFGKRVSKIWQKIFLSVFILNGSMIIPFKMLLGYLRFIRFLSGHYQVEKWYVLSSKANFLARYDQQPLNCKNSTRLKYVATFL